MSDVQTAALVGATGGAGTTRTTVELATTLAADGRAVAILDAAFATQGLSDHLDGRLSPDLTALVTDEVDAPLADGLVDLDTRDDVPGRVVCCPAHAPFERLARAKTAGAARTFEHRIQEAADSFDHVLVDVPPVAANQAIAAVNACDRVVLVTPGSARGGDAARRMRDRLGDLDTEVHGVVATGGELDVADVGLPVLEATAVRGTPACLDERPYAASVARAATVALDTEVEPACGADRGILGSVGEYVSDR